VLGVRCTFLYKSMMYATGGARTFSKLHTLFSAGALVGASQNKISIDYQIKSIILLDWAF
jgi:hypothetical protein